MVDLGQLAEALIYYEQVLLNVTTQPQFAAVLEWFIRQNRFNEFLSLCRGEILQIYEYSFATAPLYDPEKDTYMLMNVQDEIQKQPNTFERRFLHHHSVANLLKNSRDRKKLYEALRDKAIEVKADEFGESIEEARKDFADARRNALVVQAFVDKLYNYRKLGHPPEINAIVAPKPDGSHTITINIDYDEIARFAGPKLNWNKGSSLTGNAMSNRFLQSASRLECDLFLGQPMGSLVGDKLYQSTTVVHKSKDTLETLKTEVEFPDVRELVNQGRLGIDDILALRKHAKKFRDWLQSESDRDRNAIIAYHNEVAKVSGFVTSGRKFLNIFGYVGGSAIGAAVGATVGGIPGAAIGGAAGGATRYLMDIGSKAGANWRPVVFGDWLRDRIAKLDQGRD